MNKSRLRSSNYSHKNELRTHHERFSDRQREEQAPSKNNSEPRSMHADARSLSRCSTTEARGLAKYEDCVRHAILPLGRTTVLGVPVLTVASPRLETEEYLRTLKFVLGCDLRLIKVDLEIFEQALFTAYHGNIETLTSSVHEIKKLEGTRKQNTNQSDLNFKPEKGEISRFLASLIEYSLSQEASDLHLIPQREGTQVRMRIKGELLTSEEIICSLDTHRQLVTRIKVLAGLDITIHGKPMDGAFSIPFGQIPCHLRIATMPTTFGEKVVLRFLGRASLRTLESLEFEPEVLEFIYQVLAKLQGSIFIVGPTGSGKTSSLYALLNYLSRQNLSLASVEDPVEVQLAGVCQTSIQPSQGFDYPLALKALVRQDPDVIMLGEIRDRESAQIAIQASLTGHLLLSTLHSRDVFEAILRLTNLGTDSATLSQSLSLVVAQRLVPLLCERCKVFDLMTSRHLSAEIYRAVGCSHCDHTGYSSRRAFAEVLYVNQEIADRIHAGVSAKQDFASVLSSDNYFPIKRSLEKLLKEGRISLSTYESTSI